MGDAAPERWWNVKWPLRKGIVLSEWQVWKDAPAAHVRLRTGGRAQADGSDIRVIAEGRREVPRAIVGVGPGDLFDVAFPIEGLSEWTVYYGNAGAEKPRKSWAPDRGLVLETRARASGNPTSWAAMKDILKRSDRLFGAALWPRVFDAENPFGPDDDFVSDYRGFVKCPVPGTYTFMTASDDASFLFVAGELVAEWPGWHKAAGGVRGRYSGKIELEAGLHPFRYVHVERDSAQIMAAYWQVPGRKRAVPIPVSAFPGLRTAEIVTHEVRRKKVAADFGTEVAARWGLDGRVFTSLTLTAVGAPEKATWKWKFGDGTTGEGPKPEHLYLRGGDYEVTLTVTKGTVTDTITRPIHVSDFWNRTDRNRADVLERFAEEAAAYPPEALDHLSLSRLVFLLTEAGRTAELVAVLQRAIRLHPGLRDGQGYVFAMRLGDLLRADLADRDGAATAYRKAASYTRGGSRRRAEVAVARTLLELGGDPEEARKILEPVIKDRLTGKAVLQALIRLGDAWMLLGNADEARAAYRRAQDVAGGPESARRILRKAASSRTAMTWLEAKDWRRALIALEVWEADAPMDRFVGIHRIAKAKALAGLGRIESALRELTALVATNPKSEYADDAIFQIAGIERDRGNAKAADAWLTRLREEYPWSPLNR